jgi:FKBP-type peptidyl-prolyl cis-trans isomerase FklB
MFCVALAAPLFADGTNQLADEKSKISYAVGLNYGHFLKQQGVDAEVDVDLVSRAIKDVVTGKPELMTEAEAKETLQNFQKEFRTRMVAKFKAEGETFLATNKLAPGVKLLSVTLPNGQTSEMQYLVITNGSGPVPASSDKVSVNYVGTLINGTEFDSSYKRGQPASFPVTGVIKGWTEALEHMPVGSKWKLFIPSDLAYGEQGNRGIPPNSTLIFEVELLAIEAPAPAPAPVAPVAPLTSDIIKVPSAEELKKGAKVETIKQEDLQKYMQTNQSH